LPGTPSRYWNGFRRGEFEVPPEKARSGPPPKLYEILPIKLWLGEVVPAIYQSLWRSARHVEE